MDIPLPLVYHASGRQAERVRLRDSSFAVFSHFISNPLGQVVGLFPPDLESKNSGRGPYSRGEHMGKKLYVGNLSYDVDSSALQELFTPHGTVQSAEVIQDRETGRSKGFGFVEMGSDSEAQAAISALNGQEHGGRALTVNEAKPKESRGPGGGGGGGRGGYGGGGGGGGRGGYGGGGGGGGGRGRY
jgi:RNA recognition motif-containing protein